MDLILFLCAMVLPGCVLALGVDTARVLWRRSRDRRAPARQRTQEPGWCQAIPTPPGGHGHA
jgi:hypothetical protein